MKREDFVKVAEETLDSLPEEFRIRIRNVAILDENGWAVMTVTLLRAPKR